MVDSTKCAKGPFGGPEYDFIWHPSRFFFCFSGRTDTTITSSHHAASFFFDFTSDSSPDCADCFLCAVERDAISSCS